MFNVRFGVSNARLKDCNGNLLIAEEYDKLAQKMSAQLREIKEDN